MKEVRYFVLSALATYFVAAGIYCSVKHPRPATRVETSLVRVYGEGTPVIPNKDVLTASAYEMFAKEGWDETKPAVIVRIVALSNNPEDFFYRIKMANGEVQAIDKSDPLPTRFPTPDDNFFLLSSFSIRGGYG